MTYFNDMPSLFQSISSSKGQTITFTTHTPGGTGFVDHVNNQNLYSIIRNNHFDIVVMQPGTGESAGVSNPTTLTAQRGLVILDSIRKYSACAKAFLYEIPYGVVAENNYANYFGVQSMIEDSVTKISDLMQIPIVPAGECQFAYYQNNQDLLLNNSYNDVHPNYNGSYLIASCMYATIFKDSVSGTSFTGTVSSQNIPLFHNIVDSVVFQHSDLWRINDYHLTSIFSFEQNGSFIQFTNLSQNYDSVLWSFGDNQTSNEINPSHTYITNNIYNVTLAVYKGNCTEQFSQLINMQSAEILEETNSSDFEIFPNPTSDYIHLKSTEFENCKLIKLFSINGKLEKSIPFDTIISIEDLKDGVYYIQFSSEDKNFRKKIIKL
ncbi:MAG: T9SS type A sorting domain-containing protein [Flavobacteriia bacterium]